MINFFESSNVAIWVGESLYAYPALLACHIVGLAIVAGIYAMRDLRMLGYFPDVDHQGFLALNKLALAGFAINAASGFLLFISQASYLLTSIPFLSKLSCIAVAMSLSWLINQRIREATISQGAELLTDQTAIRVMACASLALWTGAIIAGRLIAYIF